MTFANYQLFGWPGVGYRKIFNNGIETVSPKSRSKLLRCTSVSVWTGFVCNSIETVESESRNPRPTQSAYKQNQQKITSFFFPDHLLFFSQPNCFRGVRVDLGLYYATFVGFNTALNTLFALLTFAPTKVGN